MTKQNEEKRNYILEAAKLYGLGEIELEALGAHLDGSKPNEYIERRTKFLFRLYDIYKSKDYNERMQTDDNGIINLNDYSFEASKRRLADSKIGVSWIISSNLEAFLVTKEPDYSSEIKDKYYKLADTNNFLLPQIAKQMGLDATVYYRGIFTNEAGTISTFHLTKNFLRGEETLIQGDSIVDDNPKKKRVSLENLLETTDRFVKKYYKKNKLSPKDSEKAREEIRRGLIKQSLFNKLVFNENESNKKWGLIIGSDKQLRLAPLFSYDYCAGVEMQNKPHHRVVDGNREDIEAFMLEYGKEAWFREWIKQSVIPFDFQKACDDMERRTGISLTDEEKSYYDFLIQKMHSKVVDVDKLNYNRELVEQNKKRTLGDRVIRVIDSVSDRIEDIKYFLGKDDSKRDDDYMR